MATVADELLNDFEDSSSENGDEQQHDGLFGNGYATPPPSNGTKATPDPQLAGSSMELDGDEEEPDDDIEGSSATDVKAEDAEDEEEAKARVEKMQLGNVNDVRSVAGLMQTLEPVMEVSNMNTPCVHMHGFTASRTSPDFCSVPQKIAYFQSLPPDQQTKNTGSIEDNPEYKLLTQSNTLSTSIDGEVILVHKFIRDHYSVRFPELETLVQNPLDYAKTVAIIGNGPMENIEEISTSSANIVGQTLKQVLDRPSLMVVTVESTTTRGTPLPESELASVKRACEMILKLDKAKKILTEYVQSRMNLFAPNLTALIGSLTAAQLLNYAGGIKGLSSMPSCNIPALGNKKNRSAVGLATNIGIRHQGFLYNSDIVQPVPSDLKVQAMRIVSAKVVLAARMDQNHSSPSGEQGIIFYDQCDKRIRKLSEAPPNKSTRALPAPDDKPARKRGGRRARKAKEATAMTDLRKAQNRMAFGKEEAEVGYGTGDGTKGLGMIGQQDDGRIRAQQIDQRTRAKLSKKNPGWGGATPVGGTSTSLRGFGQGPGTASTIKGTGLRSSGVGGMKTNVGTGGTSTSVAFTPVQGLELVDPKMRAERERKRKAEEDRWFKGGTFTQIGGGGPPKVDAQGFKVPGLPIKKAKTED